MNWHLEHLILSSGREPFMDPIESGSPLLRSLGIFGSVPAGLAQHGRLLNHKGTVVSSFFACKKLCLIGL
jgi:hypothetical protein